MGQCNTRIWHPNLAPEPGTRTWHPRGPPVYWRHTSDGAAMQLGRILREGFVAGGIWGAAGAMWVLPLHNINGPPLFPPALLGPARVCDVFHPAQVVVD